MIHKRAPHTAGRIGFQNRIRMTAENFSAAPLLTLRHFRLNSTDRWIAVACAGPGRNAKIAPADCLAILQASLKSGGKPLCHFHPAQIHLPRQDGPFDPEKIGVLP
jgi:hypothetical protein